ncbi:MAG: tRNA uridine-5-carboxymethylaminomethyl(34) synthesis GTPase MnmE [Gammaproteobacteria bacterium]|nr:tRNA uridine-5-carboxymethylaminomethyl(34) synthesis GTPase MnmE [Gammaproteobacteria bacterium]NND36816.1 tRNA uridine-5-carboxymethylaminomethyl(34) synthesis GTPase MnmE [Gammaproteobacteria bacterium]
MDTIVARATPPGRGGVAIVRVSGPDAWRIAEQVCGRLPEPRLATFTHFTDEQQRAIDSGIVLYFPGPASFTGEDVLELQGHGGPVVCELLIERILALGARMAGPGEFARRAFLNDKLDLSQAEAIADLIDSGSRAAARAATRSLDGAFSAAVMALNEKVTELRVFVEAAIDFPDEEIDFLDDAALRERLDDVNAEFEQLEKTVNNGRLLRDGIQLVLAGRPNAGKSSLLNALTGSDTAIVTDVPGTTRDVIREYIDIDGLPVHLVDTAGLRAGEGVVEQEGVRRARAQLAAADYALLVVDTTSNDDVASILAELPEDLPHTIVRNKTDLSGAPTGSIDEDVIGVSALTGAGIDDLRRHIKCRVGFDSAGEGMMTARQRHVDRLRAARAHFEAGRTQLLEHKAGELMADELLQVQNALAEITGEFSSDDLLGEIFGSFCLGK